MSDAQTQSFKSLMRRYIMRKEEQIPRSALRPPRAESVISYDKLTVPLHIKNLSSKGNEDCYNLLNKVVIVKLLRGTTSINNEYLDSVALDKTVHEISAMNEKFGTDIPLILMVPYTSYDQFCNCVQPKYRDSKIHIISICQGKYPYLDMSPTVVDSSGLSGDQCWYDPGDGNTFDVLYDSRKLQSFIYKKKEYMFISNLENSNGTLDINILHHVVTRKVSFGMEVVQRKHDTVAQLVVQYQGHLQLQDTKSIEELTPQEGFNYFSTNNLWVNLKDLRDIIEDEGLRHDMIPYVYRNDGNEFISFEITAARCIKLFEKAILINVPDSRVLNENSRGEIISTLVEDLGTRVCCHNDIPETSANRDARSPARYRCDICYGANTSNPEGGSHCPSPPINSGTLSFSSLFDPIVNSHPSSNPTRAHYPDYILHRPTANSGSIPLSFHSGGVNMRGILKVIIQRLVDIFKLKAVGELFIFYTVYHTVLFLLDAIILDYEKNEVRSSWYGSASSLGVALCMQITLYIRRRRRQITPRFRMGASGIEIPQLHDMTAEALRRQDDSDLFHNFVHAIAHFIYMGLEKTIKHEMVANHWAALSIRHSIAAIIEIIGSYIVETIFKTPVNLG